MEHRPGWASALRVFALAIRQLLQGSTTCRACVLYYRRRSIAEREDSAEQFVLDPHRLCTLWELRNNSTLAMRNNSPMDSRLSASFALACSNQAFHLAAQRWFDEARKPSGVLATFKTRLHVHNSTGKLIVTIPTTVKPTKSGITTQQMDQPHVGTGFDFIGQSDSANGCCRRWDTA